MLRFTETPITIKGAIKLTSVKHPVPALLLL